MKTLFKTSVLLIIVSLSLGCGARQSALQGEGGIGERQGDAAPLIAEAEALWQERGDRAKAQAAIDKWNQATKVDPTEAKSWLALAYAYYFMANVHIRWDEEPRDAQMAAFDLGVKAADQAMLIQNPEFAQAIKGGASWADAIQHVTKAGVASLYWYATNLGKWSMLDGFTTLLANKDRAKLIITKIRDLDETYFYGAPHRYFGVYHCKVPMGDKEEGQRSFKAALAVTDGYLDTKVLYAEFYATKTQNEELFDKLLNEVINADPNAIPEMVVENKNAQRAAQDLLDRRDDFF
ncbi:MAG: TRAP transporter TatT component family protein [Myxococcota bacterium]|nr:TRAP transporter TatT component family protein [Myxococcota bacterium]